MGLKDQDIVQIKCNVNKKIYDIKNMKILVTGGYGFIGANFITKILNQYKLFQIINIKEFKTYASNHKILKKF